MILRLIDEAVRAGARPRARVRRARAQRRTVAALANAGVGDEGRGRTTDAAGQCAVDAQSAEGARRSQLGRVSGICRRSRSFRGSPTAGATSARSRRSTACFAPKASTPIAVGAKPPTRRAASKSTSRRRRARCGAGTSRTCAARSAGVFFYLYLVVDVWSRKIVGWAVHEEESMDLAAAAHARRSA